MQFKAYCQRQPKDSIVAEHIGTDEVYIACDNDADWKTVAVILSKKDALALVSTIINHYKVEHK